MSSPTHNRSFVAQALIGFILLAPILVAAQWEKQRIGTLAWLRSIYFLDEDRGWIAGSRGTLLTTRDGGKTWRLEKRFVDDNIYDVFFADERNGWILCGRDVYTLGVRSPSYLLRTSDGGDTWEKFELKDNKERLVRLVLRKDMYGFAIGEAGSIWQLGDDPKTWRKLESSTEFLLMDGWLKDDRNALLVGGGGVLLGTSNAGEDWDLAYSQTTLDGKLNSVFFVDQKLGWIVGAGGAIYTTKSGGRSWTKQSTPTTSNLSDVFFVDGRRGVAVGDNGVALQTSNAGETWHRTETGVKSRLERVYGVGGRLIAIGHGGTLITTEAE